MNRKFELLIYWHSKASLYWSAVLLLSSCVGVLQGYRQKDYFIATQGPLAHTVDDFWRMVWEWKCHSIVMLTELQEREQVHTHTHTHTHTRTHTLHTPSHDATSQSKSCQLCHVVCVCVCCRTSVFSTGLQRTLWLTETSRWRWKETRCVTRSVSKICCSHTARWARIMSWFALTFCNNVCIQTAFMESHGWIVMMCVCVFLTGEADTFGSALSFPRLARDRDPSRG